MQLSTDSTGAACAAKDGIKVDQAGNVFVSGPGGLWIFSSTGKHLGTPRGLEHPHDMPWNGADRQTLYPAAQTSIYRIRLSSPGANAFAKNQEPRRRKFSKSKSGLPTSRRHVRP